MLMELPHEDEVHVWLAFTADAGDDAALLHEYRALLEPQEIERGERFRFERDRQRHWLTRALVRVTLSRYVSIAPQDWRFEANAFGRPHIANDDPTARRLSFNLSHTDGLVVLAIARDRTVGVDVEHTGRRPSLDIADHYFTQQEAAALRQLDPSEQHARFLALWTLKESYIKARGMGLSIPLDQFGFMFEQDGALRLQLAAGVEDSPARWSFLRWTPSADHVMALCVERIAAPLPQATKVLVRRTVPLRLEELVNAAPLQP